MFAASEMNDGNIATMKPVAMLIGWVLLLRLCSDLKD